MKIALAQINNTIGDISGNLNKILENITKAAENGIDLIIFPELAITGKNCRDLFLDKDFINAQNQAIDTIQEQSKGVNVIIGVVTKENNAEGNLCNSIILINKNNVFHLSSKTDLTLSEQKYFKKRNILKTIKIKDKTFLVNPNPTIKLIENVDILINLDSSNFQTDTLNGRFNSKNTGKTEISVNPVGINDQLIFDGKSNIINKNGQLIALGKSREEDFIIFDAEEEYEPIQKPVYILEEEIFNTLSFGLKDFCQKTGFTKTVLGLSGGIDSALAAAIAQDALGSDNVLGIKMPSKYSSEGSIVDSDKLAQNLGINAIEIPITPLFDCFVNDIQGKSYVDLAEENLQARFRGIILMSYANRDNYLVLATGNKSEAAVGYSTLYGDTCGGINTLMDLYKTQVYDISKWLNKNKEIIPVEIIEKAPSAELRPNQKDQDSLPEYDILDDILFRFLEMGQSQEEISKYYDKELVSDTLNKVRKAEFKRKQNCLGLKISKRSLAMDTDYPIVQRYKP